MVRLLTDENFRGDIVRGLRLRLPTLDMVRVQDIGLSGADDPTVLTWAAAHDRILLTHDTQTVPGFANARVIAGEPMPGVLVVDDWASSRRVIDDVILIDSASEQLDWIDRVEYLPF